MYIPLALLQKLCKILRMQVALTRIENFNLTPEIIMPILTVANAANLTMIVPECSGRGLFFILDKQFRRKGKGLSQLLKLLHQFSKRFETKKKIIYSKTMSVLEEVALCWAISKR